MIFFCRAKMSRLNVTYMWLITLCDLNVQCVVKWTSSHCVYKIHFHIPQLEDRAASVPSGCQKAAFRCNAHTRTHTHTHPHTHSAVKIILQLEWKSISNFILSTCQSFCITFLLHASLDSIKKQCRTQTHSYSHYCIKMLTHSGYDEHEIYAYYTFYRKSQAYGAY